MHVNRGLLFRGDNPRDILLVLAEFFFILYTVSGVTHFMFHVVMHNTKEDGDFPPENNESTKSANPRHGH